VYGEWSREFNAGGRPVYEQIMPRAFTRSIATKNIFLMVEHDRNSAMACTDDGTLTLREDARGVKFEAVLPDTEPARVVYEKIKRGGLGMSIGFNTLRDNIIDAQAYCRRTLVEGQLNEISIAGITLQAMYPQTYVHAIEARNAARMKADDDWQRVMRLRIALAEVL
jgi:HK97 family phage prohead protease